MTPFYEGFTRAMEADRARHAAQRLIVERFPTYRAHGSGHAVRLALGRTLVVVGLRMISRATGTAPPTDPGLSRPNRAA